MADGLVIGEVGRLEAKERNDCSNLDPGGGNVMDLNSQEQGTWK